MSRRVQTILAPLGIFSWAASSSKIRQEGDTNLLTAKVYTQVPGTGWCSDEYGVNEATARRFEQVNCAGAQSSCDSDSACVAYACMTGASPMSVLYSTTNCSVGCSGREWETNPRLITKARYTADQPAWSTATCHVAYPDTQPLFPNSICSSEGYMNSSTSIFANTDAWTLRAASSAADCESKCSTTTGCVAWTGDTSNWNLCYTTNTYLRTEAAWAEGYTGRLKCADTALCGTFVTATTSLGDPAGNSGSPWVLLPATSRENCAAQCEYDQTCLAYKGGADTGCLLTPDEPCQDFTCYVTHNYSNSTSGWETDGPDWGGAYRSGCN